MDISSDTDPSTPSESPKVNAPESTPARSPAKPRAKRPSSAVRHSVELTLRIAASSESTRALLATAIGCNSNEVVDLAVETLGHKSEARAVLTSVRDICAADPMEAGILATVLASESKALFKSAWKILVLLPSNLTTPTMPVGSANAGLAFARAAQSLDEPSRKAISRLLKDLGE